MIPFLQDVDFESFTSLNQQVSTIEFSLVEVSVLHGLKQGNDVLKEIHKEMDIETVEKLLEDTKEAREYQRVYQIPVSCERDILTYPDT
jgi:hypothetical protein